MLFIKDLNQADSGKYVCRGTYANNEEMQTQVVISTFSKYPLYMVQSYIYVIFHKTKQPYTDIYFILSYFLVGITWEDAPEDQYAVIHKDSKIRCVVKARPAAIVDWLKESLIISTGEFFSTLIFITSHINYTDIQNILSRTIKARLVYLILATSNIQTIYTNMYTIFDHAKTNETEKI